ncbi:YolD-like family protein [Fusibacter bizertensis]|uniref:YolD-like family protein n=1 Tax=Fusibacter bizertensis TaxID=1488331 RepID=A0ABT6NG76_9FIRM|nr:YolD-like family protein [Fusibacter bizertensis]MDH8679363.1 YolD-like family protein [Fusibacter bizertensis]
MASRPKTPMPIAERAKQFLPFAAVKGLSEALAKKEKIPVQRTEISEAQANTLNHNLCRIQKGLNVTVTYFCTDTYIKMSGTVTQLDTIFRTLQIEDTIIKIDDILELELEEL